MNEIDSIIGYACYKLKKRGDPVDEITVSAELKAMGELEYDPVGPAHIVYYFYEHPETATYYKPENE